MLEGHVLMLCDGGVCVICGLVGVVGVIDRYNVEGVCVELGV